MKNKGFERISARIGEKTYDNIEENRTAADFDVSGAPRYFMQKYNDNDGCIAHGYTPVDKDVAESYKEYFAGKVGLVALRGYK